MVRAQKWGEIRADTDGTQPPPDTTPKSAYAEEGDERWCGLANNTKVSPGPPQPAGVPVGAPTSIIDFLSPAEMAEAAAASTAPDVCSNPLTTNSWSLTNRTGCIGDCNSDSSNAPCFTTVDTLVRDPDYRTEDGTTPFPEDIASEKVQVYCTKEHYTEMKPYPGSGGKCEEYCRTECGKLYESAADKWGDAFGAMGDILGSLATAAGDFLEMIAACMSGSDEMSFKIHCDGSDCCYSCVFYNSKDDGGGGGRRRRYYDDY